MALLPAIVLLGAAALAGARRAAAARKARPAPVRVRGEQDGEAPDDPGARGG